MNERGRDGKGSKSRAKALSTMLPLFLDFFSFIQQPFTCAQPDAQESWTFYVLEQSAYFLVQEYLELK